jgi:hypothetical protein
MSPSLRAKRSNPVRAAAPVCFVALLLAMTSVVGASTSARADEGPGDCLGVDFDSAHPVTIARITADKPRAYFIKSAYDDAACPADTAACQQKAYLIPGDLVLLGKTFSDQGHGSYTCVAYEKASDRKVRWTNGWMPSASLVKVQPSPAPQRADWLGKWSHAAGDIAITAGKNGAVSIQGEGFYQGAQNVQTGELDAVAKPDNGVLQFADDGSVPFDKAKDNAECLVRMQRVAELLVVEDNGGCGGVSVSFTGFYKRK